MITDDMERLYSLKQSLRKKRHEFNESVKPLKDEITVLEASITEEVLKARKTVQVGAFKAEYKPVVVFKMKKEG